ncbi:VacJ-like lipoprotein [Novosphingobium aromaticivorans DSM 12444]|uniref:VacJ-like lipoprotein n=1 Tax=Novosphingobium aromaticivorans (strain ATCC 700278 / DSM 12444 / CCUG 56034 / CIP 105152 / NBRC 16084 / F199) TaxID=279238 RepID=Q2G8M0_NOVAD|nr:VacJ-like lipoprotein [Novosphingobium aromaticivorans DSM 12444]SCY04269.1 phospholipid-binding lipoprotein MlaA [Novosphingobium aromaticivorans]
MSVTLLASAALLAVPGVDASATPDQVAVQAQVAQSAPASEAAAPPAEAPAQTPSVSQTSVEVALPQAPAPSLDQIEQEQDGIVVSGERTPPQDPMQSVNQASYDAVQAVDDAVIAPVAQVYEKGVPRPLRMGLRNFLRNLTEPIVALNFLLQLKPGKAAETVGRFAVNSTVGVGGLVDVAKKKPFNLPYRRNGFAYTMGYYGIGPGPYMFLPLVGPTTLRDVIGLGLDRFLLPFAVGGPLRHPGYVYGSFVIRSLDERVMNDELFKRIREESNPYASYRELYLKSRQAEIDALKGKADFQKEGTIKLPAITPTTPPVLPPAPPEAAPQTAATPAPVFISEPVVQPLPTGG